MTQLHLSAELALPLDVVTLTTAILGIRGTGKTNTAGVLVEEALKHGQRSIIVDPLDVWWGLKSSADGRSAGFDVAIFGGQHADLPLHHDQGALLADLIVEHPITAVLSLAHLRKGQQVRFIADFAERLYLRKGEPKHRDRLMVVIDEASSFVPQQFQGEQARTVGAIEDLVRRGRSRGLGVVLIDQRAASVNKNVLTQLELLIAHRQVSPQDRAAIKSWVEASDDSAATKELVATIASIGKDSVGEAWVWSPLLDIFRRVQIRRRETFDSSQTPGPGEAPAVPAKLAVLDLAALREALDAVATESQPPDPQAIQKRLADLEAAEIDAGLTIAGLEKRIEEAFRAGVLHALRQFNFRAEQMLADVGHWLRSEGVTMPNTIGEHLEAHSIEPAPTARDTAHATAPRTNNSRPTQSASDRSIEGLSGPQSRILAALASFHSIGVTSLSKGNAAVFADQSPKSSGYRANLSALSAKGLIRYTGEGVEATPEGLAMVGPQTAPATLADLHRAWFAKLSTPQGSMLRLLTAEHPKGILREVLARETSQSPKSSGFRANLSKLSGLGLIRYDGQNVVATSLLFPNGLKTQ